MNRSYIFFIILLVAVFFISICISQNNNTNRNVSQSDAVGGNKDAEVVGGGTHNTVDVFCYRRINYSITY